MYLFPTRTYYRGNEQCASRGWFLILTLPKSTEAGKHQMKPIRCFVRKVAMRQMGHWMMGSARIRGVSITLSGTYGGDGLTCDVARDLYELGVELPEELYEKWNKGGGHNSGGSEMPALREWAIQTMLVRDNNKGGFKRRPQAVAA